jgi:hypothetical protein
VPWWEYFVGVMLVKAYRDFEDRVGVTSARRGAKRDMIRDAEIVGTHLGALYPRSRAVASASR